MNRFQTLGLTLLASALGATASAQDGAPSPTPTPAWTAGIRGRFALKLSHALARLNTPPLGKRKTDTIIAAALVAKF